jgi:hypothetical protein
LLAMKRNGIRRVDSSTIVLVSDKTICTRAIKAYNSLLGAESQPPSNAVYVIQVGTSYIVRDPVQRSGEWYADVVFDRTFVARGHLLS